TPRILIIDDKPKDAELLGRALNEQWSQAKDIGQVKFEIKIVTDPSSVEPYLIADDVDIYIVDLKLKHSAISQEDVFLGEALIKRISETTNAGVIVFSSEPAEIQSAQSLLQGADDYVWKSTPAHIIQARVLAL